MTDARPLSELLDQLHEVNRQLAEAARPLDSISELDLEQRKHLGDQIRAALERWEVVTKQINQRLAQGKDVS